MNSHEILEAVSEVRAQLIGKPVAFESPLVFQSELQRLESLAVACIQGKLEVSAVAPNPVLRRQGVVGMVSLYGTIVYKASSILEIFGIKSLSAFMAQFRELLAIEDVGSIVIDVASAGGSVFGVPEAADEIFHARDQKPIVAIANPASASAAYWLMSAAQHVAVIPSGVAGNIGVFVAHQEGSKMEERLGIKTTVIRAGKFKGEGNPHEPLTEEAREHMQSEVNRYYDVFTKDVGRFRGATQTDVINGFGQGRIMGARDAVNAGLADWSLTFDQVIDRLANGEVGKRKMRAEADPVLVEAQLHWTKEQYE